MVDVRQAAGVKIFAESLSQHDKKHVVPPALSRIRVGKISGNNETSRIYYKTKG
jgi:hypothetical protein